MSAPWPAVTALLWTMGAVMGAMRSVADKVAGRKPTLGGALWLLFRVAMACAYTYWTVDALMGVNP